MRKIAYIFLILLSIILPWTLYLCSAEANGDESPPTFTLDLEPARPSTWDDWRPEYQTNVSFVATIKGKTASGETITRFTNVRFTFDLGTPSKWKGVCMNFNGKEQGDEDGNGNANEDIDTANSYDLFFRRKDNPSGSGYAYTVTLPIEVPGEKANESGQEVETGLGLTETGGGNSSVTVSVRVNDYGAIGILSASTTFNYEDPNSGSTSPEGSASGEISIPLDNNGNDIADGWLDDHIHDYNPWDDKENGPGSNMNTGDGLTVFEEYRSFWVQGQHKPTLLTEKDLFIYSEFENEGVGHTNTSMPAAIEVHQVKKDEIFKSYPDWTPQDGSSTTSENLAINPNKCIEGYYGELLRIVRQRALWVVNDEPDLPFWGYVSAERLFPLPPHRTYGVYVDGEELDSVDAKVIRAIGNAGINWPQGISPNTATRRSDMKKQLITHEVGHGVALFHPFGRIPERRPGERLRYHDKKMYSEMECIHEDEDRDDDIVPPHDVDECGAVGTHVLKWDSGTTVMDYGSESVKEIYKARGFEVDVRNYLTDLEKSLSYLNSIHDTEYILVEPDVLKAHQVDVEAFTKPHRQTKPQWSPPNDGTNGNTNTETDSDSDTSTTNPSTPDAPTGISMTPGDGQIELSWSTVSGTVTDYEYRYSENGGSWSSWISAGLVTRVFVMNLTNGSTYVFEVRAKNGQVVGVVATTPTGETPVTVPAAPTISRIDAGDRQVNINWTKPSDDGGAAIEDYKYQYRESNGGTWRTLTSFGFTNLSETTILSEDIAGLTNGTEYEFQVCAVNRVGNGAVSSAMTATPLAPTPPPVPPSVPVWSNIPDPFNLTVGDSFSLDLNSYVTGSPTITRNLGAIPAGLSFSNGVLSGTVTGVETRSLQFTATNSAGTANSEWVDIAVAASTTPTETMPVWSDIPDPYTLTVGDSFSLDLNSYVTGSPTITRNLGAIPAGLSLSNGVLSGTVSGVETRSLQFTATNAVGSAESEWVDIAVATSSTPTETVPVWSDIPDPFTLTVGDSFSLDLNSYVTGSPTITRNLGAIPAGLSFSNGVLSGPVTGVETRSLQFTATNSAGTANSEWVQIIVQAAQ